MKKIAMVIGTRPEAIKLLPVYLELKKHPIFEGILISTGQHREMLEQIFTFFQVKADLELSLMQPDQTLASMSSLLITHLDQAYKTLKPDLIIVQGDTTTAMTAAIAAFYNKIEVAHVEAGLRSNNKMAPYPEEFNRKMISQIADIHFSPTAVATENLKAERIGNIFEVGNTVIDALLLGIEKVKQSRDVYEKKYATILSQSKQIILITAHRRESFGEGLENICIAIKALAVANPSLFFVFPVHLNPNIQGPVKRILGNISNIMLLPPLPYDDMIFLLNQTIIVMTDSGGIQEEAPTLNVPFIVLRNVTERPEGISAGCGILGGIISEQIISAFNSIYHDPILFQKMKNSINPYGDGQSAKRIVSILQDSMVKI